MLRHLLLLVVVHAASAQTCSLVVSGQNRARRVMGPVNTECPGFIHTSPFGNWGVTSNFGLKHDGHQFQGWCQNSYVCDNSGICRTECQSQWYQWNSCTDHPAYRPPNRSYYNSADGTQQNSTTGINTHGSKTVEVPVACPGDSDGDGLADTGGCSLIRSYNPGVNFMSVYELDPVGSDELVQSIYFPDTPVITDCGPHGCAPTASDWVAPNGYDSPKSPARIFAELRSVVSSGVFLDRNNACRQSTATMNAVSGATFRGNVLAVATIGSAFGLGFATAPQNATTRILPLMLGGVSLRVEDSTGVTRTAGLFHVSPTQINFEMPQGVALGEATLIAVRGENLRWTSKITVDRVAPGLFSADSSGRGAAAALVTRLAGPGSSVELGFDCSTGTCLTRPVEIAPGPSYLTLFGTGIRYGAKTSVIFAGTEVAASYAGPQVQYTGLDQVNAEIPAALEGRGEIEVWVVVDGVASNRLRLRFR